MADGGRGRTESDWSHRVLLCSFDQDDTSNQHLSEINLAAMFRMEYTGHVHVGAKKSLRGQALFSICIFLVK